MAKGKKKEERTAFQNWRSIYGNWLALQQASKGCYSESLERRTNSRETGVDIVTRWMGEEVAQHPEFHANAPQNVLDQWFGAGINHLGEKYQGNLENNWTGIMESLPKDGLASIVLEHLPPVEGIKKYRDASKAHESYQEMNEAYAQIEELAAAGHEKKSAEMFRETAMRYLAGYVEEGKDGKDKLVPGEIQKNLESDPDIKVRGDKVVKALAGELINACRAALCVYEGAGQRYVHGKLVSQARAFYDAAGKDVEVYAGHSLKALKAGKKYAQIGFALGQIREKKK